jgi:hypothetical protein
VESTRPSTEMIYICTWCRYFHVWPSGLLWIQFYWIGRPAGKKKGLKVVFHRVIRVLRHLPSYHRISKSNREIGTDIDRPSHHPISTYVSRQEYNIKVLKQGWHEVSVNECSAHHLHYPRRLGCCSCVNCILLFPPSQPSYTIANDTDIYLGQLVK